MPTTLRALLTTLVLLIPLAAFQVVSAQEPVILTKAAGKGPATAISELSQLRGRQIWMVNAPQADCAKMEALGMIVDCEQGRETYGMQHEIVIWCQEFDHAIAAKILGHLGRSDFSQRTHVTNPQGTNNGECGMLFEITIRYRDAASTEPAAPVAAPTAPSGGAGGIFSKEGGTATVSSSAAPAAAGPISQLNQLRGRQIWMVNAPAAECAKMEALGMIVDCDQGGETYGMERDIVIWCQEFDHGIAGKILSHLGRTGFDQRTHVTEPDNVDNEECGQLYEITMYY